MEERFASAIKRIRTDVPEAEAAVLSSAEIAFRLHGLGFAKARIATAADNFSREQEIVFGSGAHETLLAPESEPMFQDLMRDFDRFAESTATSGIRYGACSPNDG